MLELVSDTSATRNQYMKDCDDEIGTVDFMIFVQETDKVIGYY